MRLDRILSQFRVIAHRLQQTKQKKTEDMLFKRASEIVRRNRLSLSRFLENPLVARWTEHMEETVKNVRSQCSAFYVQRLRRSSQIFTFYRDLYGDNFVLKLIARLRGTTTRVGNRLYIPRAYLCAAAVFCWKEERITDDQIKCCIEDMKKVEKNLTADTDYMQSWECVVSREDFKIWRKPLEGTDLYQYKMYGTYNDVSPRAMFQVQKDLEYRKTWDSNVIDLRIVDTDAESGSEIVHWVTHYPSVLNDPRIKITQAKDVRWLSHDAAIQSIRKCLESVITSLEREAQERSDVQAMGLSVFVQTYDFVATVYMMSDALPILSQLSRAMQKRDLDYSFVRPLVTGTISAIAALKDNPGQHFQQLGSVMEDLAAKPFRFSPPTQTQMEHFRLKIYDKYMEQVVENLQKRFPDMPLLEAFSIFDPSQLPEDDEELAYFGQGQIEYPMYSREYVYVRKCKVDTDNNVMVVLAGAVEHPSVPVKNCYVRVTAYHSEMVIKPHKTFDENGLDYVLTYYDDPQAVIPSVAYHWMASKGVPNYVDQIRSAAKDLQSKDPQILRMNESDNKYNLNTMSH